MAKEMTLLHNIFKYVSMGLSPFDNNNTNTAPALCSVTLEQHVMSPVRKLIDS